MGESNDSDSAESEELIPKVLPKRTTRGKRMGKLLDKEDEEADEQFWEQEAWQELDEDRDDEILPDEYSTDERLDSEDSDISQSESEEEQDEEAQLQKEMKRNRTQRAKQGGVYRDPARRKVGQTSKVDTAVEPRRVSVSRRQSSAQVSVPDRSLRNSTKRKATVAAGLRKVEEAKRKKKLASRKKVHVVEAAKLTQQELLEEAAKTEFENKRSLQVMLMIQAEKKRQTVAKSKPLGPRVHIVSRTGAPTTLTFTGVDKIPSVINCPPIPYPAKPVCVITGLPAKYRDPKSGVPYATLQAFKAIRSGLASKSGSSAASRNSNKITKSVTSTTSTKSSSGSPALDTPRVATSSVKSDNPAAAKSTGSHGTESVAKLPANAQVGAEPASSDANARAGNPSPDTDKQVDSTAVTNTESAVKAQVVSSDGK